MSGVVGSGCSSVAAAAAHDRMIGVAVCLLVFVRESKLLGRVGQDQNGTNTWLPFLRDSD